VKPKAAGPTTAAATTNPEVQQELAKPKFVPKLPEVKWSPLTP